MGYYGELQNGELLKTNIPTEPTFVQQGWQCPICGRVYSPFTPMCYSCGGEQKIETSTQGELLRRKLNEVIIIA